MQETSTMRTVPVDSIIWRKDLYPRFEPDPATIQRYAESIEHLPPIEVNQRNELIDGYHRWTAHKKAQASEIAVTVTETASDAQLVRLAIERNATHGLQLSMEDKRSLALKLYDGNKEMLASLLSVSKRTIANWVDSIDRAIKEERKKRIFEMWLACYTQEEIGEMVGIPQQTLADQLKELPKMENLQKSVVLSATFSDADFTPPLYNLWSFAKKSNEVGHFGNTEQRIVDNLLYLYTEPFDIVVDPFGGGGSTIDACKKRLRRYWVSDRLPVPERQDIRQADIAAGPPPLHKRWGDVSLMYLDPPYWRQAQGQYSKDPEDLANMPLEQFYQVLTDYIDACARKMRDGAHIALIIQPTQWLADGRRVVDHVFDLVRLLSGSCLAYEQRIICPYATEQYNPQQVEWAKANKQVLNLNRELIVWRVCGDEARNNGRAKSGL